jgi:hypothetical protein
VTESGKAPRILTALRNELLAGETNMDCIQSQALASATTPTACISIAFNLDQNIHAFLAEIVNGSLTYIFQVCAPRRNDMNHTENIPRLFLVLVAMIMVVVVSMGMAVRMGMTVVMIMVFVAVTMIVLMPTIAMTGMAMRMAVI